MQLNRTFAPETLRPARWLGARLGLMLALIGAVAACRSRPPPLVRDASQLPVVKAGGNDDQGLTRVFHNVTFASFHASYQPHNRRPFASEHAAVIASALDPELLAGTLQEMLKQSSGHETAVVANIGVIITSAERKTVADALGYLPRALRVTLLNLVKDEYTLDVLYYVSEPVFEDSAPYLAALARYERTLGVPPSASTAGAPSSPEQPDEGEAGTEADAQSSAVAPPTPPTASESVPPTSN
jgi:hypothetical protein